MSEKRVWKYKLLLTTDTQEVEMDNGAAILSVAQQGNDIYMWALAHPQGHKGTRKFLVVGTGWELPSSGFYHWGTVHAPPFVWHVFEVYK